MVLRRGASIFANRGSGQASGGSIVAAKSDTTREILSPKPTLPVLAHLALPRSYVDYFAATQARAYTGRGEGAAR